MRARSFFSGHYVHGFSAQLPHEAAEDLHAALSRSRRDRFHAARTGCPVRGGGKHRKRNPAQLAVRLTGNKSEPLSVKADEALS